MTASIFPARNASIGGMPSVSGLEFRKKGKAPMSFAASVPEIHLIARGS
jgi:hypothetical protein